MSTPGRAVTTLETYLNSQYSPDCEYWDGELVERNLGEKEHSILQRTFVGIFFSMREAWRVETYPELRMQLGPARYRVPDIVITRRGHGFENILRTPPLLCIEIISPQDSLGRLREKARQYLEFGVENVWIADPYERCVYIASAAGEEKRTSGGLSILATPIHIELDHLFAELDRN